MFSFFAESIIKMLSAKVRGTRFDVPGDEKETLGDPKKKVRNQQVGVTDLTAVLA